jgi:hypothetical protein
MGSWECGARPSCECQTRPSSPIHVPPPAAAPSLKMQNQTTIESDVQTAMTEEGREEDGHRVPVGMVVVIAVGVVVMRRHRLELGMLGTADNERFSDSSCVDLSSVILVEILENWVVTVACRANLAQLI